MKNIVLMSDSHTDIKSISMIRNRYLNADYLIHCGDAMTSLSMLNGFVAVAGNMDDSSFPFELQLEIEGHRILVKHGHDVTTGRNPDYKALARYAKRRNCDILCFGHTHIYFDQILDGVRLLNPGSVWNNRDNTPCSYMEIMIDGSQIVTKRKNYNDLLFDKTGQVD